MPMIDVAPNPFECRMSLFTLGALAALVGARDEHERTRLVALVLASSLEDRARAFVRNGGER